MAIPEFHSTVSTRVPQDVRSQLEMLSLKERKPLSNILRAVIIEGLRQKMAPNDDFIELEALID
jgi:predicted DNA-binding protein